MEPGTVLKCLSSLNNNTDTNTGVFPNRIGKNGILWLSISIGFAAIRT